MNEIYKIHRSTSILPVSQQQLENLVIIKYQNDKIRCNIVICYLYQYMTEQHECEYNR